MNNIFDTPVDAERIRQNPLALARTNAFIQRVFVIMTAGLAITGFLAYGFAGYLANNPEMIMTIFGSGLKWVIMLAPFAFILALNFGIERMSYATATLVFAGFATVMGISLSSIFLVYTGASIAATFFVTAGTFGAMALIGATTKRDLTKMGSYLMMALIGIIIASVVNIFLKLGPLNLIINIAGILIFCGLTAYDVQKLMRISQAEDGSERMKKYSVIGALSLYLNFINLFLFLLRFMGSSRD